MPYNPLVFFNLFKRFHSSCSVGFVSVRNVQDANKLQLLHHNYCVILCSFSLFGGRQQRVRQPSHPLFDGRQQRV